MAIAGVHAVRRRTCRTWPGLRARPPLTPPAGSLLYVARRKITLTNVSNHIQRRPAIRCAQTTTVRPSATVRVSRSVCTVYFHHKPQIRARVRCCAVGTLCYISAIGDFYLETEQRPGMQFVAAVRLRRKQFRFQHFSLLPRAISTPCFGASPHLIGRMH